MNNNEVNSNIKKRNFNNYFSKSAINAITDRLGLIFPSKPGSTECSYGWFNIRPVILQRFASPRWTLFWLCWSATLQGLIVNGFVNVVITTIEKRYHLSSTESGLIVGAYDISGLIFLIPVSYFGETRSKPKFIAFGVLLLAFGSFLFSMPYLISGQYHFTRSEDSNICHKTSSESSSLLCENKLTDSSTNLSNYLYLFVMAMILNGAAASPFYTLGCTYIEENTSRATSSLYLGIYYTMAIFGPALGYIIGGQLLRYYVDFGVDVSKLGLTPSSNVWVGMWWLGFMIAGLVCLIVILPISGLPRKLPGHEETNAKKVVETHNNVELSEAVRPDFGVSIKDLPVSLKILMKNGPFMLISIASSSDSLIVGGLAVFGPKITEQQFGLTATYASLLIGIVALSAAGGGNFLGSYLLKRFDMNFTAIMKMCVGVSIISLGFTSAFAISCPNGSFAGLNTLYTNESLSKVDSFQSSCNSKCLCSRTQYDPICGANNVQYYSPCYAACQQSNETGEFTTYSNCGCISQKDINSDFQAERRRCPSTCNLLPAFLTLQFCLIFCTFLMGMPSLTATLRCVAKSQKSFALGIQWLMIRLIGTIPAPIIFGSLIDSSCTLWQNSCRSDSSGSCLFYDNALMSKYMLILVICSKLVTCTSVLGSWFLYKPPKSISGSNSIVPKEQMSGTSSSNSIINCDNLSFKPHQLSKHTDTNGYVDYIITSRL